MPAGEVLRGSARHSQSGLSLLSVDLHANFRALPPVKFRHARTFEARALEDASGVEGEEYVGSGGAARETGDSSQVETVKRNVSASASHQRRNRGVGLTDRSGCER